MKVAVAIITDFEHKVLITRRSQKSSQGGLWEFPGGKLEGDESPEAALIREIKEEVGLAITHHDFLGEISYAYAHHEVSLLVFHVTQYSGHAICCEEQMDLRWVNVKNLHDFSFPPANEQIIALFKSKESKGRINSKINK